jgi:hypothetical protein
LGNHGRPTGPERVRLWWSTAGAAKTTCNSPCPAFPYLYVSTRWKDILLLPVTQPRAVCYGWLSRVAGAVRGRCHDYKCGLQVDDLGVVFTGHWAHIRAVACLGVWEERKRSAKGVKDDYAYSGWLPAGTGRVEGSAKWCNDAENESKGTGSQSEYLALGFMQHAGLHLQLPCSPCRRSRPPLAHHQYPRHAQAQAVF